MIINVVSSNLCALHANALAQIYMKMYIPLSSLESLVIDLMRY